MRPPKTITIVGNIGSGKSTFSAKLAEVLKAKLVNADPFETNPFFDLYAADHARWALATELHFQLDRAKILEQVLSEATTTHRIIDSGLLMGIHVYVKHHLDVGTMTQAEWELFSRIVGHSISDKLVYPDVVIFMHCDIDVCLRRIKSRGRTTEKHHTREYLSLLEKRLQALQALLRKKGIQVLEIDTTKRDYRQVKNIHGVAAQIAEAFLS